MCGLTGVIAYDANTIDDLGGIIRDMTEKLRDRGPDSDGFWTGDGVALGHRRLSIVELSPAGAQPMISSSERYVLAYNGEIYNHLALRRALEQSRADAAWRGGSDTETLLAGIEFWGLDETLRRAHGMFAVAVWDRQQRRLSLARDRLGEKPLYWGYAGPNLVFGSELKALRAHPDFAAHVCPEAVQLFLRFAYVPAPRSIYRGVWKLEPGCILDIEGQPAPLCAPLRPGEARDGHSVRRYWWLNDVIDAGAASQFAEEAPALTALERSLSEAVGRQMMADVPLGAFLSGGIDSSLIVALMQQQSDRPVRTFTVGFAEAAYNEAPHAAAVARHLATDHTELMVSEQDARDVIPLLPDMYDEPFADSSQIPTFLVCQAARRHVTVALSGDGGDELFGGYNRYFWGPRIWNKLRWMPHPVRTAIGAAINATPAPAWDAIGALSARAGGPDVGRLGEKAHRLASRMSGVRNVDDLYRRTVSCWSPDALKAGAHEPASLLDDPLPATLPGAAARMMAQDMRSYLPDDIMCKVDRAAMAVSLETRAPFLDPDVVAVSQRLPVDMKIRNNSGKWALRQILYRHVPQALIERPKTGFSIPIGAWLRGPLRPWAEGILRSDCLSPYIDQRRQVDRIWAEHLRGTHDHTPQLWTILMLGAWLQRWLPA